MLELGPRLRLEWQLASLPGAPPHPRRRVQQRELVRPGREAALAAKVVEAAKHRHRRVVRSLLRELVELAAARLRERLPAAGHLEPRRFEEQRVQAGDRGRPLSAQVPEPVGLGDDLQGGHLLVGVSCGQVLTSRA